LEQLLPIAIPRVAVRSLSRIRRMAKYNELLKIENAPGEAAPDEFLPGAVLVFSSMLSVYSVVDSVF
jgi:hypothetical protein